MTARCAIVLVGIIALTGATPLTEESGRSLRIGSNNNVAAAETETTASATPGYSVSFVPLFSLLANFFPRLLSKFSGLNQQQPATRDLGRSSKGLDDDYNYIQVNNSFCSPTHIGQWDDTNNCQQFYKCETNSNAPPYCDTSYRKAISKDLVPSRFKGTPKEDNETEQYLQVEQISTPCITLTYYQCPEKFLYSPDAKQCIPMDDASAQKLCHF